MKTLAWDPAVSYHIPMIFTSFKIMGADSSDFKPFLSALHENVNNYNPQALKMMHQMIYDYVDDDELFREVEISIRYQLDKMNQLEWESLE